MAVLKQSTAFTRMFLMVQSSDHISALTGASPTVTISKAGAAFGSAGGSVTEVSSGWYKVALNTTDTNTLGDLAYHITATSGDATDFVDQVTANILGDAIVVTTNNDKTGYSLAAGQLAVKKNTALSNFMFVMTDSTNHNPATGLTVTATRSIDGAAFASCANSVSEVTSGWYKINLAAADLNGTTIALRFAATGADDRDISILTQA